MDTEIAEQMAALLGFVVYLNDGEVRIPRDLFENPPKEDLNVEAYWDDASDSLLIRLVPLGSAG